MDAFDKIKNFFSTRFSAVDEGGDGQTRAANVQFPGARAGSPAGGSPAVGAPAGGAPVGGALIAVFAAAIAQIEGASASPFRIVSYVRSGQTSPVWNLRGRSEYLSGKL